MYIEVFTNHAHHQFVPIGNHVPIYSNYKKIHNFNK